MSVITIRHASEFSEFCTLFQALETNINLFCEMIKGIDIFVSTQKARTDHV